VIDAVAPGPGDEEDEEPAEDGHVLHEEVWWPGGPNNPDVCRIEPFRAELWDGPAGVAVAAFEFAKAARLVGRHILLC
jgi:hypothetical protein